MNEQLENIISTYSLDQHREYILKELANIDSYLEYSEATRKQIKIPLFIARDEIEIQLKKKQNPTQL
jgi:hypothetical protein